MQLSLRSAFVKDLSVGDVLCPAPAITASGIQPQIGLLYWPEYPASDPQGYGSSYVGQPVVAYTAVTQVVRDDEPANPNPTGVVGAAAFDVTAAIYVNGSVFIQEAVNGNYEAFQVFSVVDGNVLDVLTKGLDA